MNSLNDQQLLRDYAGKRSEDAFTELVRRHAEFVDSAALRVVRDAHLAEDVTRGTFLALGQSAPRLADCPVLSENESTNQDKASNRLGIAGGAAARAANYPTPS